MRVCVTVCVLSTLNKHLSVQHTIPVLLCFFQGNRFACFKVRLTDFTLGLYVNGKEVKMNKE